MIEFLKHLHLYGEPPEQLHDENGEELEVRTYAVVAVGLERILGKEIGTPVRS